jgi:excinuclease ABC subunit B
MIVCSTTRRPAAAFEDRMGSFRIISDMVPRGDQPQAIEKLSAGLRTGRKFQTLMGVTGSGKTFTMAHVVQKYDRPTLVISHNKTLAAQLYEEFKSLFPENAVEYFVSYYDYYQPEAYIPQRDIYIEKDAGRNDDLDRLRLKATSSLMSRSDVLIVASVSCIFGLGSPQDYAEMMVGIREHTTADRDAVLKKLIAIHYERAGVEFARGKFRVRGDTVEIWPAYEEFAYRVEFFGDQVERLEAIHPLTGESLRPERHIFIYPAKHYVMPAERMQAAVASIRAELEERLLQLRNQGKLLEAQRLSARTRYDIEMMLEVGYCSGIENYSRHLSGRAPGEKPYTLIDFFPKDFLLLIDESHATLPQLNGMWGGDRSRKEVLVEHGFRLPSALDNRPLRFEEFAKMWDNLIFVSATPGKFELEKCGGEVVEQVIRPTGLIDPLVHVVPARGQVKHLLEQVAGRVARQERVLVTTLTKRLAEDLSQYVAEAGFKCEYLHSDIDTLERVEILRELREGKFDVLVGVNLLREGLDLPEVSMVAILDADKEGFLRSETSLIQTIGRTARNVNAEVFLYADKETPSMQRALGETNRRRALQLAYNTEHGITPQTIKKEIARGLESEVAARYVISSSLGVNAEQMDVEAVVAQLQQEMMDAAKALEFEKAAAIRDRIDALRSGKAGNGRDDRKMRRGGKGGRIPRRAAR